MDYNKAQKIVEVLKTKSVHCDTEEKTNKFFRFLHDVGFKWSSGESLLRANYCDMYGELCYFVRMSGVTYGQYDVSRKKGGDVISYEAFMCYMGELSLNEALSYLNKTLQDEISVFRAICDDFTSFCDKALNGVLKGENEGEFTFNEQLQRLVLMLEGKFSTVKYLKTAKTALKDIQKMQ